MMWKDPIVAEVHAVRLAFGEQYAFDIERMLAALQDVELPEQLTTNNLPVQKLVLQQNTISMNSAATR